MIKNVLSKLTRNQNLSQPEIFELIGGIGKDEITEVQIAGFLVGLLMKGPTVEEVSYIAKAMRANCKQIHPKVEGRLIDMCGTGGGLTTFNVSTANTILTAAAGIPVAKHGSRSISSSSGSADALEALGVQIDLTPEQGEKLIEEIGIGFLYAPNFHPVMLKVLGPEDQLGIKTIFFTIIGPLINPADAKCHLLGVYQPELVPMAADILVELDFTHAMVVHGLDGLDEISILGKTSVAEVKQGKVNKYEIEPEDFDLKRCSIEDVAGGDPQYNADTIRNLYAGKDEGPHRDFLILNNGAALYIGGLTDSLEEGIKKAKENLASGTATRKLEEFIERSNAVKSEGQTVG
ncbi:MAG: anthranilate phosphoribosyltransferase [Candidatus Binatia bacterium]|nr:anthranilate phosphoribosyltransferase [Candidatus Binatia bacterium]